MFSSQKWPLIRVGMSSSLSTPCTGDGISMISLHLVTESEALLEASTKKVSEAKNSERDMLKTIAWINQNLESLLGSIDMRVPSSESSSRFPLSSSLDDVEFLVKYMGLIL